MTTAQALHDHIEAHRDDLVELLRDMIRIPSITGEEARMGAFVAAYCRDMGLSVEIVEAEPGRPNVVARWDSGLPGRDVLLNDHLDIVPPGPLEYWSAPPFGAEIRDGRVIGRGAIDTKSGLATLLMATRALRETGLPLSGTLTLIFSCDEEVGGALGMQHLAAAGYLKADMALVAEPTSMRVEIATKGRLNLSIQTQGLATHAARPWLGHNAIDDMADVILALRRHALELGGRRHDLLGPATLSVGTVEGGTVPNMVPNRCVLGIDRRVLPDEDADVAEAEIRAIVDSLHHGRGDGYAARLVRQVWWPGYVISPDEPVVGFLAAAFEAVTGRAPEIAGKDAGTDASWINRLAGIPVVMFSPGHGPDAMNADESVSIEDLVTATKVVARFLHDVMAVAPQDLAAPSPSMATLTADCAAPAAAALPPVSAPLSLPRSSGS